MSDVIEQRSGGDPVSEDDLRRMLEESRGQIETLTRERDTERATRTMSAQELEAERLARIATEQERDGFASKAQTNAEERYKAQVQVVKTGISVQQSRLDTAEEAYARHAELGDWKAAAKAQREIAEAAARLDKLKSEDEYLETNKEKFVQPVQAQPQRQTQAQPTAATDPISRLVGGQLHPQEREWLGKRPKFVDDKGYRDQVFGASQMAVGRGHTRGTPAYFQEMERILGEGQTEQPRQDRQERQEEGSVVVKQERAPSADLAPQRRSLPGQAPSGSREVRLTADQAEVADGLYGNPNSDNYIPDQADRYRHYWNNLEKRRAAGRM